MREILFRGKRLDNGEWIEGNLLLSDDSKVARIIIWNNIGYDEYPVDPATVGQFTGAINKNGNKIFEGDILYPISRPYLVFWDEEKVKFALKNSRGFCLNLYQNIADEYIVIGNIHDNPELMKGGNQ